MKQENRSCTTDGRYQPTCQRKTTQYIFKRCACLLKERAEGAHAEEQDNARVEHYDEGVNCSLRHHRSQRLGEGGPLPSCQHTATGELTSTGYDQ